jgi:hypothetical protein
MVKLFLFGITVTLTLKRAGVNNDLIWIFLLHFAKEYSKSNIFEVSNCGDFFVEQNFLSNDLHNIVIGHLLRSNSIQLMINFLGKLATHSI